MTLPGWVVEGTQNARDFLLLWPFRVDMTDRNARRPAGVTWSCKSSSQGTSLGGPPMAPETRVFD